MNSSEMPWMRCWPFFRPVDSVGDSAGSTGWTRTAGWRARRHRPTPITVPPVPDAGDERVGRAAR